MSRTSEIPFKTEALRTLAREILDTARQAAQRAVEHARSPSDHPLPSSSESLEATLYQRLNRLPAERRAKAQASQPLAIAPQARAAQIDRQDKRPALVQLSELKDRPILDLDALEAETVAFKSTTPGVASLMVYRGLNLAVTKVKCIETTSGAGDDEISLTGSSTSADGRVAELGYLLRDKKFSSGATVDYAPAKTFAAFEFDSDDTVSINGQSYPVGWPRRYAATFMLAEIDNGGFPKEAKTIVEKLQSYASAEVKAAVAGAVGSLGGPAGTAIAAALTFVAGKLTDWIITEFTKLLIGWWEDDVFTPLTTDVMLARPATEDSSGIVKTTHFWWKNHGGHYEVHYRWRLTDPKLSTTLNAGIQHPAALHWRPLPGRQPMRAELFSRGLDRNIYRTLVHDDEWLGWEAVNGEQASFKSSPTVASWAHGRLELFALGEDDTIYQNSLNGHAWSGWNKDQWHGHLFKSAPAVTSRRANHVDVFAVGLDGHIYNAFWNGESWSGLRKDLPVKEFLSAPAVTHRGPERLDVVAMGKDRRLYISSWHDSWGEWSPWDSIGVGAFVSSPAICSWSDDRLHLFARGDDRGMRHAYYVQGEGWSGWSRRGEKDTFTSGPAVFSAQAGVIELFAVGDDRRMYRCLFDGTAWSEWFTDFKAGYFQ